MNKTLRCALFPLSTCLSLALACSSSSSSPSSTEDGGAHHGGDSGGGTSDGGSTTSNGGCETLVDGQVAECLVFRIDGKSDTPNQAACAHSMMTYVATCPTKNLVGCCTSPANTGVGTATEEQCFYTLKYEGGEGCVGCGIGPDGGTGGAAQAETMCKASGAGVNPGTWSTTP